MSEFSTLSELDDADLELVLLYVDGELANDPGRQRTAEGLLADNPAARAIADDVRATKAAVRELVVGEAAAARVTADLSMVRGRVMTRIPPAPRPAPAPDKATGFDPIGWLRAFGFGKVSVAFGAAVVAAVWIGVALRPAAMDPRTANAAAVAEDAVLGDQPVIIEEMEVDGESITVKPAAEPDRPTVIWHFADAMPGEG
ncbi:MAG: hypothetical protein FJ100_04840 [Deltaproteobacteria bacterium]|nr:hypothetical protein [Deltaproteobacteria bacterium]